MTFLSSGKRASISSFVGPSVKKSSVTDYRCHCIERSFIDCNAGIFLVHKTKTGPIIKRNNSLKLIRKILSRDIFTTISGAYCISMGPSLGRNICFALNQISNHPSPTNTPQVSTRKAK